MVKSNTSTNTPTSTPTISWDSGRGQYKVVEPSGQTTFYAGSETYFVEKVAPQFAETPAPQQAAQQLPILEKEKIEYTGKDTVKYTNPEGKTYTIHGSESYIQAQVEKKSETEMARRIKVYSEPEPYKAPYLGKEYSKPKQAPESVPFYSYEKGMIYKEPEKPTTIKELIINPPQQTRQEIIQPELYGKKIPAKELIKGTEPAELKSNLPKENLSWQIKRIISERTNLPIDRPPTKEEIVGTYIRTHSFGEIEQAALGLGRQEMARGLIPAGALVSGGLGGIAGALEFGVGLGVQEISYSGIKQATGSEEIAMVGSLATGVYGGAAFSKAASRFTERIPVSLEINKLGLIEARGTKASKIYSQEYEVSVKLRGKGLKNELAKIWRPDKKLTYKNLEIKAIEIETPKELTKGKMSAPTEAIMLTPKEAEVLGATKETFPIRSTKLTGSVELQRDILPPKTIPVEIYQAERIAHLPKSQRPAMTSEEIIEAMPEGLKKDITEMELEMLREQSKRPVKFKKLGAFESIKYTTDKRLLGQFKQADQSYLEFYGKARTKARLFRPSYKKFVGATGGELKLRVKAPGTTYFVKAKPTTLIFEQEEKAALRIIEPTKKAKGKPVVYKYRPAEEKAMLRMANKQINENKQTISNFKKQEKTLLKTTSKGMGQRPKTTLKTDLSRAETMAITQATVKETKGFRQFKVGGGTSVIGIVKDQSKINRQEKIKSMSLETELESSQEKLLTRNLLKANEMVYKEKIVPAIQIRQGEKLIQEERNIQADVERTFQQAKERTAPILRPYQEQKMRQPPRTTERIITYNPPPPPPPGRYLYPGDLTFKVKGKKYLGEKRDQGYNAYIRQGKKYFKATPYPTTKDEAMVYAGGVVDNSAQATFTIRKAKGQPKMLIPLFGFIKEKFYEKKNRFTEKNTYRIDSQGELEGITAKGLLALQKKTLGGFNYGLRHKIRKNIKRR